MAGLMHVTETRRYEHVGGPDVATAAELMEKLPSGWTLKSFAYQPDGWDRCWVAIVEGPTTGVKHE